MSPVHPPIAKPQIRLRQESDDWVILFDPDTGNARVLNPIGAFIWEFLDGGHRVQDIVEHIRTDYSGVAEDVEEQVNQFIEVLAKKGFVEANGEGTIK